MEDDYFVGNGGKFVGVFDGHGGGDVSCHLRKHLHRHFQRQWERKRWEWDHDNEGHSHDNCLNSNAYSSPQQLHSFVAALRAAFDAVDREVLEKDAMQYQGSTAVTVAIHIGEDGCKTLVSANVGDSRAVLCRNGSAVDLTRDHKPSDERERARIEKMGEQIEWDNYSKVHRVKNLSLSRAIGDRFAKPTVSGEAEISLFPVREEDEFVVLASDGVWDVMTSEQVVNFIQEKLDAVKPTNSRSNVTDSDNISLRLQDARRKTMSRYVVSEALKRGSGDNICVVIVWLKPLKEN
jgi:serine/threonine protein phosphatase PrpC